MWNSTGKKQRRQGMMILNNQKIFLKCVSGAHNSSSENMKGR